MTDLAQLALQLRGVLVLGAAADPSEAERAQRAEMAVGLTDPTSDLRDLQLAHSPVSSSAEVASTSESTGACSSSVSRASALETGNTSAIVLPRSAATSSGRTRFLRPSTVARVMLIGVVVPRLLASTSRMPASLG